MHIYNQSLKEGYFFVLFVSQTYLVRKCTEEENRNIDVNLSYFLQEESGDTDWRSLIRSVNRVLVGRLSQHLTSPLTTYS